MKPLAINMSKVKKIASDKNCSTFKHEDGHEIKIAHSALSTLQRKQIEKLPIHNFADGGDSDADPTFAAGSPTPAPTPASPPPLQPAANPAVTDMFHNAFSGKNPKYAKGGEVQHYDNGTDSAQITNPTAPIQAPASVYGQQPVNAQPQPVQQGPGMLSGNGLLNAPSAFNLQQKSAREQQAVDSAKGAAQASAEDGYNKQRAAIAQQDADNVAALKQHTDNFNNYIQQNPINPKHYQENMSSGQKMTTAIGLALGGFGNGMNGRGNPAMDFLNKQIDRDIDGQKARADQQKTVWGAYEHLYGDQNVANNLAKVSMNDIYSHKMNLAAAQLATPQAKAIADGFASQKAMENNQLLLNASQNAAIETANGHQGSGPAVQKQEDSPGIPIAYIDKNGKPQGTGPQATQSDDKAMQQKPGSDEPNFNDEHSSGVFPILAPNADKFAKYGVQLHPFAKQDAGEINSQVQQARQVEKVLNGPKGDGKGGVHDLFQQMYTNSGRGDKVSGLGGAIQRTGNKAIGAVTGVVGKLLGEGNVGSATGAVGAHGIGIPAMTEAQKSYETNQARLKTDLASGLKGLISVNDLDDLVDKFTPGYADSPAIVKQKEEALVNSIRNSIKTDKLEQYNLLAKPKK